MLSIINICVAKGAFNITAASSRRSLKAQQKVDKLMSIVDSELTRHTVNDLLNEHLSIYNSDISVNERKLGVLPRTVATIENYPLALNLNVSDRLRLDI
jgi:hypothetical protein